MTVSAKRLSKAERREAAWKAYKDAIAPAEKVYCDAMARAEKAYEEALRKIDEEEGVR